jgi:putative sigma-54 modulation protein
MQITIKSKQMEVSDHIRMHIERKLRRLSRLTGNEVRVEVTVSDEKTRSAQERYAVHLAFANIPYAIRGTASGVNVTTALDLALDKVTAQLSRQKGRQATSHRLPASPVKILSLSRAGSVSTLDDQSSEDKMLNSAENEEIWSQIVEIRRVHTKPMSDDQVIAQMEEEGLAFYPFINTETDSVNVMYRLTNNQGYGLLVPATKQLAE